MHISEIKDRINGHAVIITEDGMEFSIHPKAKTLLAAMDAAGAKLGECELGLLDYSYMKNNWQYVDSIYRKIGQSIYDKAWIPPTSYENFIGLSFHVYSGIKPYMIYLTRQYAIHSNTHVTWYYNGIGRRFVNFHDPKPFISGDISDIIDSAQQGDAPEPATNVDPASPSSQPPAR